MNLEQLMQNLYHDPILNGFWYAKGVCWSILHRPNCVHFIQSFWLKIKLSTKYLIIGLIIWKRSRVRSCTVGQKSYQNTLCLQNCIIIMNYLAKIRYFTLLVQKCTFCTFWQKSHFSETKSHFSHFPALFQMPWLILFILKLTSIIYISWNMYNTFIESDILSEWSAKLKFDTRWVEKFLKACILCIRIINFIQLKSMKNMLLIILLGDYNDYISNLSAPQLSASKHISGPVLENTFFCW